MWEPLTSGSLTEPLCFWVLDGGGVVGSVCMFFLCSKHTHKCQRFYILFWNGKITLERMGNTGLVQSSHSPFLQEDFCQKLVLSPSGSDKGTPELRDTANSGVQSMLPQIMLPRMTQKSFMNTPITEWWLAGGELIPPIFQQHSQKLNNTSSYW